MISGVVNPRREAIVVLQVRGPSGRGLVIPFVVDSGFSGELVLPSTTIAVLGLTPSSNTGARLADGKLVKFDSFLAEVNWDGVWRAANVLAIGDEPLLGMRMLAGHELRIAVVPGRGGGDHAAAVNSV